MTTEKPNPADGATQAAGGSAAGTADFDRLLAEYTTGTKSTDTQPTDVGKVLNALKPVIDHAQTELAERHKTALKKDLDEAINFVKEEDGVKDIPPKVIRGMLEGYAAEHPEFATAFENRSKDKAGWQTQLATARKAVAADLKDLGPGTRVVSDVAAAKAAVSGSSSTPPPRGDGPTPQDMFSMPEHQWRAHIAAKLAG
jgi:hypothetical protein